MLNKKFIRIKLEGAKVLELDPNDIKYMRIMDMQEPEKGREYFLAIANSSTEFVALVGRFDECHFMLNQIHDILDIKLIDI